jgi:hypothetical protein
MVHREADRSWSNVFRLKEQLPASYSATMVWLFENPAN